MLLQSDEVYDLLRYTVLCFLLPLWSNTTHLSWTGTERQVSLLPAYLHEFRCKDDGRPIVWRFHSIASDQKSCCSICKNYTIMLHIVKGDFWTIVVLLVPVLFFFKPKQIILLTLTKWLLCLNRTET